MRSRPVLFRFGLVAIGYLAAVGVATAVTLLVMLLPSLLRPGMLAFFAEGMGGFFALGFVMTFLCALPGFLVAVIIGERRRWNRWISYALAGMANVVPSLAFFAGTVGSPLAMPVMVAAVFPAGFAGGLAYWLSAGRAVAARRPGPRP